MIEFGDVLTAVNLLMTIILTWAAYQLNRRIDRFSRKYTHSVQRLERLRTLLARANQVITLSALDGAVLANVEAQAKGYAEFKAILIEVAGTARVIGGDIFKVLKRYDDLKFFPADPNDDDYFDVHSEHFANATQSFGMIALDAFEAIERQLEKELETL